MIITVSVITFLPTQSFAVTSTTKVVSTKEIRYRFSPTVDKCYAEGTKEFKKLSKNRIYKTLGDCAKKLKNKKNAEVLGVSEKKDGARTNVSLIISDKK